MSDLHRWDEVDGTMVVSVGGWAEERFTRLDYDRAISQSVVSPMASLHYLPWNRCVLNRIKPFVLLSMPVHDGAGS